MVTVNQGLRLSDLQAGQRVKIHGTPGQPGILVARSVSVKEPDDSAVIEGPIEHLDLHKNTLRILGRDLVVPAEAEILDRSRTRVDLASLEIGDVAKLKGTCASRGFVVASIKQQPRETVLLAELQGRIEGTDEASGTLQAVGFTVVVTDETTINAFPESVPRSRPAAFRVAVSRQTEASARLVFEEGPVRSVASDDVSEYLRMPVAGGARLARVDIGTGTVGPGVPSSDSLELLIDSVNADLLTAVAGAVPGPAYLLAFVSGSPVRNRLQQTRPTWRRLSECLSLDTIARELEQSFDPAAVDTLLRKLRRSSEAQLLLAGSRLGPAKLLFRCKGMDESLLSTASYNAIDQLVSELSLLASDCDEETRQFLREADLGKSAHAVRRRLDILLRRFEIGTGLGPPDGVFGELVRIQDDCGCLHPALPVSADAVRRVARALDISHDRANRMITLFRFAWLCGQEQAEGASDFAIKGLVAIPHGVYGDAANADDLLERLHDTVVTATGHHAGLRRFRERYPDVRIEVAAQLVAMPQPLFEHLSSIDGADELRLDFFTRYRLGAERFTSYVAEQRAATSVAAFGFADSGAGLLDSELPRLFDEIVYLSAKEGKKRAKRGLIEPIAVSPKMLRDSLERMLSKGEEGDVNEWSWRFNEAAKCDLVGRIRGLWSLKAADA